MKTTFGVAREGLRQFGVLTATAFALFLLVPVGAFAQLKVSTPTGEVKVYEQSDALLISAAEYTNSTAWPALTSIPSELRSVSIALKSQGFGVTTLANPTADQLIKGVRDFLLKAKNSKSRALVYFSGHGWTDENGVGYLVGADAPGASSSSFKSRLVSMEMMRTLAKDSAARHTFFVFDSCYSGSIFVSRGNQPINAVTLEELQRPVTQFLSSGSSRQRVPSQSPFAPAFVDAINGKADYNGDGVVQASEIALYVQTEVVRVSSQTPQFGHLGENGGHVIFRPNMTPVSGIGQTSSGERPQGPLSANTGQEPKVKSEREARSVPGLLVSSEGKNDFRSKYPGTQVYYYRKGSDGTTILDMLNKSNIPYVARPAELSDAYPSNALACGPKSDIAAVKALGLKLLDAGAKLQAVYTYEQPERKGGRVQINAYGYAKNNPPLSREDIEAMTACPKKLTKASS